MVLFLRLRTRVIHVTVKMWVPEAGCGKYLDDHVNVKRYCVFYLWCHALHLDSAAT